MEIIFIKTLKELSNNNINYALLRKPLNWENTVDLDIILIRSKYIHKKLKKIGYQCRENSSTYIKYNFFFKKWIYLDINNPLKFGNQYANNLLINDLIKKRYLDNDGIYRVSNTYESLLYLIHAATNKGFISAKYRYLLYENYIDRSVILEYNNQINLSEVYEYLSILRNNPKKEKFILLKVRKSLIKINFHFLKTKFKRIKNFIMGPQPIVFLGPDGSGKSTLAKIFKDLKSPNLKLIYMGPNNELEMNKLLFKLLNIIKKAREKHDKKTLLGFISRIIWYVICYFDLSIRVWRTNLFASSGGLVLCDRYACDMYFRKPNFFTKIIFLNLFLRPRFVFLCVGNPKIIFSRKPELQINQIKLLIKSYRQILKKYNIKFHELNTTDKPLEILIPYILNKLNNVN